MRHFFNLLLVALTAEAHLLVKETLTSTVTWMDPILPFLRRTSEGRIVRISSCFDRINRTCKIFIYPDHPVDPV